VGDLNGIKMNAIFVQHSHNIVTVVSDAEAMLQAIRRSIILFNVIHISPDLISNKDDVMSLWASYICSAAAIVCRMLLVNKQKCDAI